MHLRIASYNLHKCQGMTGPYAPERNLAVIAGLNADIVALQEVDFRWRNRPEALPRAAIEAATGMVPAALTGTSGASLGWHGQTFLLRPDLAKVAQLRRLPLPGIEPRGAIALRLPDVTVIAVHLGLARSSRRAQLARLAAKASSALAGDRVVVTGDYNEWRVARGLESLAHFQIVTPGKSWPAIKPWLRYDRLAISPGLSVRDCGVYDTELARRASDHLPIWAELALS